MILDDLGDYLTSQGGFSSTDLFAGWMPEAPDTVTVLYETGGAGSVWTMSGTPGTAQEEQVRVQVTTRGGVADYQTARRVAQKAYLLLDGFPTRTINGVGYKWGKAVQAPFLMGRDETKRPLITFSVDIWKTLSTTS